MRAARVQPRPIPMRGNRAANSHASPKRQREETATGVVRRAVFPCLRCGLGWTVDPSRGLGWTGDPSRGLGWTVDPSRAIPMQARSASERKPRRGLCGGPYSLACAAGLDGRWTRRAGLDGRGTRRAGLDGRWTRRAQFPCKPEAPARGNRDGDRTGLDNAVTSAGRGARRADPFARASGWLPPPPPRSAARRSPRRSPLRHAAPAGSA